MEGASGSNKIVTFSRLVTTEWLWKMLTVMYTFDVYIIFCTFIYAPYLPRVLPISCTPLFMLRERFKICRNKKCKCCLFDHISSADILSRRAEHAPSKQTIVKLGRLCVFYSGPIPPLFVHFRSFQKQFK